MGTSDKISSFCLTFFSGLLAELDLPLSLSGMTLPDKFLQYWKQNFNFSPANYKLLLAVSGGIDSVVMTDLFYNTEFDFAIAHCNFNLRAEESERDEVFVIELSKKYNKKIFTQRFATEDYAAEKKISIQEAARELRYNWFSEVSRQWSAANSSTYIATAHNADDNIETALMFFLRGSGIRGLTGIKEFDRERKIIRPLLFATREDILIYAKENNIGWVEDSSNLTNKYTRNFLRNKLIPLIKDFFPDVKNNIKNNINRFKEIEQLYNYSIQQHKKNLLEYKDNEIHIPVLKLQKIKPLDTIIWEIIKEYNFHTPQIDEIKKLFTANNSSYIKSSTHRIIKNRNWLIIGPNKTEEAEHILIEDGNSRIRFKNGFLEIKKFQNVNCELQTAKNIAQLDASNIEFPLLLRKWKQGDYFYPLGMQKKKKLNRFFIDHKLSSTEKEKVWVLESNNKILWVVGYRIDNRFKITQSTKEILKIAITN
jgi:tRNA(Ile)-lysidine synthase